MQRSITEPKDRRAMLRVKVKSLMVEAAIIRAEERKARDIWTLGSLHQHRVLSLRSEARHSSLALGLIKGRTWRQMEVSCVKEPDWEYVQKLLTKFGPKGYILTELATLDRRLMPATADVQVKQPEKQPV